MYNGSIGLPKYIQRGNTMEFYERLNELRKQKGYSQEELAGRLDVTRQTISKWETGDSTPDMEKLIALGELFGVSLDTLVLGKEPAEKDGTKLRLSPETKAKTARWLKIAGIAAAVVLAVDFTSLLVYFFMFGLPG